MGPWGKSARFREPDTGKSHGLHTSVLGEPHAGETGEQHCLQARAGTRSKQWRDCRCHQPLLRHTARTGAPPSAGSLHCPPLTILNARSAGSGEMFNGPHLLCQHRHGGLSLAGRQCVDSSDGPPSSHTAPPAPVTPQQSECPLGTQSQLQPPSHPPAHAPTAPRQSLWLCSAHFLLLPHSRRLPVPSTGPWGWPTYVST